MYWSSDTINIANASNASAAAFSGPPNRSNPDALTLLITVGSFRGNKFDT